jgi:hypothetical protein
MDVVCVNTGTITAILGNHSAHCTEKKSEVHTGVMTHPGLPPMKWGAAGYDQVPVLFWMFATQMILPPMGSVPSLPSPFFIWKTWVPNR